MAAKLFPVVRSSPGSMPQRMTFHDGCRVGMLITMAYWVPALITAGVVKSIATSVNEVRTADCGSASDASTVVDGFPALTVRISTTQDHGVPLRMSDKVTRSSVALSPAVNDCATGETDVVVSQPTVVPVTDWSKVPTATAGPAIPTALATSTGIPILRTSLRIALTPYSLSATCGA